MVVRLKDLARMDMGIKTKGGRGSIGTEVKVRHVDDTAQHHQVRNSSWHGPSGNLIIN